MNINKLDHVALLSSDSKASRLWYQRVFEMEWVFRGQWEDNPYFLKKGDAYIAIFQNGKKSTSTLTKGSRIDHFAFRADSKNDYEDIKETLRKKGIHFEEQDHEIARSIYLKDPDDITVEVTTYDI